MRWIVFDVDGVLIDVSESYDLAVKKTVEYFVDDGDDIGLDRELIRRFRKIGAFGDDYKTSEALIIGGLTGDMNEFIEGYPEGETIRWARERFSNPFSTEEIEGIFDTFYLGERYEDRAFDYDGLWKRERCIVREELLKKVERRYQLGVITGRSMEEMKLAQDLIGYEFENLVTRERFLKPDPEALHSITEEEMEEGVYIGDSKTDELMVENYNERYGSFDFLMVERDVKDVNEALKKFA